MSLNLRDAMVNRIQINTLIIKEYEKELEVLRLAKSNEYIQKLREQAWYVRDVNFCNNILKNKEFNG
jgi:valyl-tRNA synthetase